MSDILPPRRGTKALELWCRRITDGYAGVKIENMTTSWKNGLGFCAIIHHFRPDLIEFDKLDKNDIFHNNDLAFRTAEKYLGIPALLEAVDMTEYDVPDRLSILTYLSQFHRVFGNQETSSPDHHKMMTSTTKLSSPSPKLNETMKPMDNFSSPSTQSGGSIQKRELCTKCNLPVFLAERVFYKNHLYHNSCLKCTKCNVQLMPGKIMIVTEEQDSHQLQCQSCSDKAMGMLLFDDDFDGGETDEFVTFGNKKQLNVNTSNDDVLNKSVSDEVKHKSVKEILDAFEKKNKTTKDNGKGADNADNVNDNNVDDVDEDEIDNCKFEERKNETLMKLFATKLLLNDDENDEIDDDDNDDVDDEIDNDNNNKKVVIVDNNELNNIKTNDEKTIEILNNIDCISSGADDNLIVNKNISNNYNKISDDDDEDNDDNKNGELIRVDDDKIEDDKTAAAAVILEDKINDHHTVEVKVDAINEKINENIIKIVKDDDTTIDLPVIEKNCDVEKCIYVIDKKIDNDNENDDNIQSHSKNNHDDISFKEINKEILTDEVVVVEEIKFIDEPSNEKLLLNNKSDDAIEDEIIKPEVTIKKTDDVLYPQDLNPFGDDDEEDGDGDNGGHLNYSGTSSIGAVQPKPRISTNPFGDFSDDDDDNDNTNSSINVKITPKRTPVPTPRKSLAIHNTYGSSQSINSLTTRHKKGKAPPPPVPPMTSPPPLTTYPSQAQMHAQNAPTLIVSSKEQLYPSTDSQPNSGKSTPKLKKKRPAPTPPSSTPIKQQNEDQIESLSSLQSTMSISNLSTTETIIVSDISSDINVDVVDETSLDTSLEISVPLTKRRLIPLDISLIEENQENVTKMMSEEESQSIDYKRKLILPKVEISTTDESDLTINTTNEEIQEYTRVEISERQMEKLKDNKESQNRNRQNPETNNLDTSNYNKWRHSKGPAPALPICRNSIRHELSNQEIKHELEVIKVQQQGLEKQGVILEKMIRRRSEEVDVDVLSKMEVEGGSGTSSSNNGGRDVEDLIIQLFEIVNEKNELFRRQAELLNLRRQYRLEQEQADLEYKIRISMAQPERNKTDTDKEHEDSLIQRLVHVVQQRNEVVECFEMDRLREIEEDMSIKQSLELHTARRDTKLNQQTLTKLSKKEKKKLKEALKMTSSHKKNNKIDVDKDEDETEIVPTIVKPKKHKFIKFSIIK